MKTPNQKRQETYEAGLWAEAAAGVFLRFKGYSILKTRFKTPLGEIDIIAKKGDAVVFCEIKKRQNADDALEAVTPKNRARVRAAAELWLASHATLADKCDIRFDVIALSTYCKPIHIENAF